jgi:hypothetical protein
MLPFFHMSKCLEQLALCVVPAVEGVIPKPEPLHETRLQQQSSAPYYWAFPLTYSDRKNWNAFTATQLAQRLHNLQGAAGEGLARERAVGGVATTTTLSKTLNKILQCLKRISKHEENDSADEDEEDDEDI